MKKFLCILYALPFLSFSQSPNFSEDIAPIFYNKCTQCHHSGGVAPFSLIDYTTAAAFSNSGAIPYMVSNGLMPPWPPDSTYQNYAHERTLDQNEIDLILDWANIGSPEGNPALAPTPPSYTAGSILPNPDLVLKIPTYTSTALNEDEYICFSLPTGLSDDRTIKAIEVVPGNRQIVHHTIAFLDSTNNTPSIVNDCMGIDGKLLAGYTPGAEPTIFPNGSTTKMGMRLPANSNIVLQMHYPKGSVGMQDSTAIHLFFYPDNENNIREVYIDRLLQYWLLHIPANTSQTFNCTYPEENGTINNDMSVLAIFPHMHLIGKNIETYALDPFGDTIPLVKINNWDFEWQGFYHFQNVLKIPAGSKLYSNATYDNTASNPHNPSFPPVDVYAGEATTDEMFLTFFMYLPYQAGDENLDLEELMTLAIEDLQPPLQHNLHPNPTNSTVFFQFQGTNADLSIWNILGEKVLEKRIISEEAQTVRSLKSGIYVYQIKNSHGVAKGKLIIQ